VNEAPFITRRLKETTPESFWGLRAQGVAAAQDLSGKVWTDYNLHDPGVTILEQVCYALTDLVYRADHPVADHLTDADGHIDFTGLALHPAEVVFPCRPATGEDLRRLLLDRIADIEDAKAAVQATPGGHPDGLWRVELRLREGQLEHAAHVSSEARTLLRAHRNLCEDVGELWIVREHACDLHAAIEVSGPRDPVDIVADVYYAVAEFLAPPNSFISLDEALALGLSLEEVFDGPPMRHGLPREPLATNQSDRLFMSELIAAVGAVDGVAGVRLVLARDGAEATPAQWLERRGPGWALRLRLPEDDGQGAGVRVTRRETTASVPADAVRARYEDLQASRRAKFRGGHAAFVAPRPRGRHIGATPYCAVQDQFPATYGVNREGVGPRATADEKAWAWQLKGYLVLFDQVIAHSAAQLAHLQDLYAVQSGPRQTYWWQMLGEDNVPGIADLLYTLPAHEIEQRVYRRMDDFYERKGRVLDYLLALHGETYSQNTLRQFGGYYTADEMQAVLHENKAQFAGHVILLGRDRCAGFDDSRPCWNHDDNVSGLQRRVSLLLGFRHQHERPLVAALQRHGGEAGQRKQDAQGRWNGRRDHLQRLALERADLEVSPADNEALLASVPAVAHGLDEALLRVGAHPNSYWLETGWGGPDRLILGPDEHGAWWNLGEHGDAARSRRVAGQLRNLLLRINRESEGLHVVEHLLLRPEGASPSHQLARLPMDFYSHRLTAVFPRWPARCRQHNFRHLAEETVGLNCPAHVDAQCVWLDFHRMVAFENVYEAWLSARLAWCRDTSGDDATRVRMNHAAARLAGALRTHRGDPEAKASP
jgi:hypothetical protein